MAPMSDDAFNIADILDLHARSWADKPAIVADDGSLTHAAFADRVRRTAGHLAALGVAAGSRVGIALADRPAHLVCLFALARLGAVVVPMDVRWSNAEKARLAGALEPLITLVEASDTGADLGSPVVAVDDAWDDSVAACEETVPVAAADDLPVLFSLSSGTTAAPSGPLLTHRQFYHRFVNQ